LSPKLYGEILKAAKPDFKETFQSDAVKKAFQFPEPHGALNFLRLFCARINILQNPSIHKSLIRFSHPTYWYVENHKIIDFT
jgi:hypothetical protein